MIVYFGLKGNRGQRHCIVKKSGIPKGVNPCYFCPCITCTEYTSDGLRRVKVDARGFDIIRKNKLVEIVKIIDEKGV